VRWFTEDIATYLQTLGVGTIGTNIFIGNLPSSPSRCIGVYSDGGPMDSINAPNLRPNLQILIRGEQGSLENLSNLVNYVFNLLDNKWNICNRFKGRITAKSLPGLNYRDDAGNWVFPLNFQGLFSQTETSSITIL
jgi:hypothetical protein